MYTVHLTFVYKPQMPLLNPTQEFEGCRSQLSWCDCYWQKQPYLRKLGTVVGFKHIFIFYKAYRKDVSFSFLFRKRTVCGKLSVFRMEMSWIGVFRLGPSLMWDSRLDISVLGSAYSYVNGEFSDQISIVCGVFQHDPYTKVLHLLSARTVPGWLT